MERGCEFDLFCPEFLTFDSISTSDDESDVLKMEAIMNDRCSRHSEIFWNLDPGQVHSEYIIKS